MKNSPFTAAQWYELGQGKMKSFVILKDSYVVPS